MTEAANGRGAARVDAPSEVRLRSRHRPVEPGLLEAGVNASRPLEPLRDALYGTLGSPSREEVRRGVDTGRLRRDPVLWARLVRAVCDHARRCGAGRIVAADPDTVSLASAVAECLVVPLDPYDCAAREPGAGPAPYLVARVLHEREEGRFLSGRRGRSKPPGDTAGSGAMFRIRSPGADLARTRKYMYFIEV